MNGHSVLKRLRDWAHMVKRDVVTLYLAARDPRVPWLAKILSACVAAYALSPIDLIPDFIPVIGYLDDVILVPLGIQLAVWRVPKDRMAELRTDADLMVARPTNFRAAIVFITIWLATAIAAAWWFLGAFTQI